MSPELQGCPDKEIYISSKEWQILRAKDAVETFAAVKSRRIDLVVLHYPEDEAADLDLPDVLRKVAPADYLPVLILVDELEDRTKCKHLDSGADDVVSYQASIDEIFARIRSLLRIKRLHDDLAASRKALEESIRREQKLLAKLRQDNEHLQELCTTDPLTHLQNVRSFRNIFDHEFKSARRYGTCLSLMTIDVDHFKVINDNHGHPSGDYVLKEMAVILSRSVRDSDVVARTGGDEFTILLPNADREQAAQFARRIRAEVYKRKFEVYGQRIHATLSVGIATYGADDDIADQDMLAYFADQALLLAKERGRDQEASFHEIAPSVRDRLRLQYARFKGAAQADAQAECHQEIQSSDLPAAPAPAAETNPGFN
jgi:diguanylate cyclase (GGDEF)-like protein